MTSLKHAEIICHMAKHGFESVEGQNLAGAWVNCHQVCNPLTHPEIEWRIKPATITYTVTVPEPMRVMPKDGDMYWTFSTIGTKGDVWNIVSNVDKDRFARGRIWDTEAKAQAAFDALFGPLRAVK